MGLREKRGIFLMAQEAEKTLAVVSRDARIKDQSRLAEKKWREARRRFLMGGAAALPVIVNVTSARADALFVGPSVCASLGGEIKPSQEAPSGVVCVGDFDN